MSKHWSRTRGRVLRFVARSAQALRIASYRLISNLEVSGRPTLYQPLHTVGAGRLSIQGRVNIGVFPSPYFFSSCAYIEARHPSSSITIDDGTWINNAFT